MSPLSLSKARLYANTLLTTGRYEELAIGQQTDPEKGDVICWPDGKHSVVNNREPYTGLDGLPVLRPTTPLIRPTFRCHVKPDIPASVPIRNQENVYFNAERLNALFASDTFASEQAALSAGRDRIRKTCPNYERVLALSAQPIAPR